MKTWCERLREHALTHYTEDGWDILVEHWTNEYIYQLISDAKSYEEAVILVSDVLSMMNTFR
jgi:hypothetical protein